MRDAVSAARSGRQLHLRRGDRCRRCAADLPAGIEAWGDPASRTVTCLACMSAHAASVSTTGILEPIDSGQAGASALREYQRRHDVREEHARAKLGSLGVVLAKAIGEPPSTRVWQQGGNGEVRVAERLEKHLDGTGVRLLHDRRVPGHGQANIDHLAVGPGGVTVIDAKTHHGKITRDWSGGLSPSDGSSFASTGATRPSSSPASKSRSATSDPRSARLDLGHTLDVAGALCFANVDGLPWLRRIEIRGILVDGPKSVSRLAGRSGPLDPETVEQIWAHLARAFPPA